MTLFSISLLCDIYYVLSDFTSFLFILGCFFLFQVHFCSIFPHLFTFLAFFFSFVLHRNPSCASFVSYYFQFYPYWPFVNPTRRAPRPSEPSGKPKSLLTLLLGYFGLELVNLLYFYPPSHAYRFTGNQPTPKPTTFPGPSPTHPPRGLWK